MAGSTISGNRPLLVAERDNPWLPSALYHQVLFHPLWPDCLSARLYSTLFQANECDQRVLNHRLNNFGWFNTQSKFNILTPAFKIESLFLRHLEPCLPETTLEARCALERRPNWTRSVREMKRALVVKGWAFRVLGGQELDLLGPRGSRGRPSGSQCQGVKGWAYSVPWSQGVSQRGPRGSRGGLQGTMVPLSTRMLL